MKKYTFRKFINDIHLWLGIGSGIILFTVCLSGTIYVFSKEITEWIDKEKVTVAVPDNAKPLPVADLVALLEKEKKDSKVTNIQITDGGERSWLFTLTPKDILLKRSIEEREAKQKKR
ncbi:MAG: PepSY domain-containing protein [Sporocytophaga sp.]|nr:PepSY domain-containing protein [Sporocytophaga sp.]